VSGDTPRQIRMGRGVHGLGATMLSDTDLKVTELYNVRHERGLAPKPGVVISMPIPTAILVDATGTVRWIDQAENYQRRSHPDLVLAALDANLPAVA